MENDIKQELKEIKESIETLHKEIRTVHWRRVISFISVVILWSIVIIVLNYLSERDWERARQRLWTEPPLFTVRGKVGGQGRGRFIVPSMSGFNSFLEGNLKESANYVSIFYLGAEETGDKLQQFIQDHYRERLNKGQFSFEFIGKKISSDIAQKYSITSLPALLIFKPGSNQPAYIIREKDLQGLEDELKSIIENNFGDAKAPSS